MICPTDLRRLPTAGKRTLISLLNQCERDLIWPWQLLLSVVMVMPKPNKGDRALALLPQLLRCWELLHRDRVRRWAREHEKEWDAAIAGNSCLREALRRLITDECADALDVWET
eukprot:4822186-Pyramimonas_sp.AAC.1